MEAKVIISAHDFLLIGEKDRSRLDAVRLTHRQHFVVQQPANRHWVHPYDPDEKAVYSIKLEPFFEPLLEDWLVENSTSIPSLITELVIEREPAGIKDFYSLYVYLTFANPNDVILFKLSDIEKGPV